MTDVNSPPPSTNLVGSLDERLSALLTSSSQFSVASYLNLALETSDNDSDELQRRMAELALQLQLQTQTCHEDIGRIGAELQAILPRCAADVGRVGVGLEGMRLDAQALLEATAVENEQQELSTSLETLSTLHALQSNLSKTKEVLTAAATWDSTMSSIPPLLAQQNLTEAVNALAQLENGERALRGMPNPEERKESIAKIRQQVQVLLQPQLKHSLQNMNTRLAPLQQCVDLYTKLGKMDSLREEYVKNRPGSAHKAWFAYSPSYTSSNATEGSTGVGGTSATFDVWLPTWYETVLSLLTEERRQASSVFGPQAAPEIIVKVMRECFRPILPSFQSRLESLFSSNPALRSKGSLETVCAAYESTLRFLSVAYELVAGAFLDVAESGMAKKGDTGVGIYKDMLAVCLQVASPFTNYQQRFAELEAKHLEVSTSLVSKDIHQAVGSVSSSSGLEKLQDAIERLKDLAPFIFPMTEGSLNRFELLNGGYSVAPALAAVDKIVTNHVGEIGIAIRTMSAAMTSDINRLADAFDEQHVLCALEVLKLAGAFVRDLNNFESKTRDRLAVLAERVGNHIKQEAEVEKASSTKGGKASSFSLPDSLSVVDIDSMLTKVFCGDGSEMQDEEENLSLSTLHRLSGTEEADRPTITLYPESSEAIKHLAHSCHSFVFDVCASVPRKHLSGMSEMPAWKEASSADAFDSYGTLPQQYITNVGEHMLALVQALEPFAEDPQSLAVANEVMEGVRDVALQPWTEFIASAGVFSVESIVGKLMDGKDIADLVLNNAALTDEDARLEDGVSDEERASAEFCNAWLDVVGLAVTGRLLERVMRIAKLTPKGCEHLTADLNYLINVFSALGVAGHPHPLVSHFAELANLPDEDLKSHVLQRDRNDSLQDALRAVEARIALMRGLSF